ncbi:hypothetical protein B0H19DRAFT_1251381 [Mycena capillaripes]|nr:hypothetical protein B0H19DRAFT_1251381 [Mycena capillaripes]
MASSVQPVVVWDQRGIKSPRLIPKNIEAFVRAQLKQQVPQPPNVVYAPVSWDDAQAGNQVPYNDLMDAPFIGVVTFVRIANPPGARASNKPKAGVLLKAAKQIIGLTPGQTKTPCNLMFPAAIFPPDRFEPGVFDVDDPTHLVGLINDGIQIEYLISYWKKTTL